jgi:hypothetical protein
MTTPKRALTYTVTRHYAPDLARQAPALLRLLAPTSPQTTLASGRLPLRPTQPTTRLNRTRRQQSPRHPLAGRGNIIVHDNTPPTSALEVASSAEAGTRIASPMGTAPFPCPTCASAGPHLLGPGAGPHHTRLVCGQCRRWSRWLPKPCPVAQEGRP